MNLKQRWQRFRAWQLNPIEYRNRHSHTVMQCANCGTEFSDNYCPRCGQQAGVGRVNWKTVRNGIALIWGMDSRSLPFTLLQLVLRPGYMINDYLSGKRQVSFPPVKMLLIVSIMYLLFEKLSDLLFPEAPIAQVSATGSSQENDFLIANYWSNWFESNPGWGFLTVTASLILPTWALFRHSPRHNRHSLPEGFFLQVFMATIIIMTTTLSIVCPSWVILLIPIYYVITYKQLFGYGWWATLWRILLCVVLGIIFFTSIMIYFEYFATGKAIGTKHAAIVEIMGWSVFLIVVLLLTAGTYLVGRFTEKRRVRKQATSAPVPENEK